MSKKVTGRLFQRFGQNAFIVAPRRGAEVEMIDRADIGSDSHGSHSKATPVLT